MNTDFDYAQLHDKKILYQTIQFSTNTHFKCKNQYSEGSMV